MTPKEPGKVLYELRYTKDKEGWGFIITTPSGDMVSKGYPKLKFAQAATQDIVAKIIEQAAGIEVVGRKEAGIIPAKHKKVKL